MFINLRSGLKTAAHISYLLGVLSIVFAMALSLVNFPVGAQTTDAPQLSASGCSGGCSSVSSTFTNIGTADMPGAVNYQVLYRVDVDGAPWNVVGGGSIGPLAVGESQTVFHSPNNVGGFYRFRASQPAGYSGPSVVYSNPCKFECVLPSPTPVTPTATPVTPTSTPVTPTATPVTPTSTPVTPTATPVTPTATPITPTATLVTVTSTPVTPTPQEPTGTPGTPTSTPVTPTPQEPSPTPQEPTVTPITPTPQEPTPTPQEPTGTPVTATPQEPTPTPQEPTSTPGNPTATPETTTPPGTTTPIIPVTGETPTPQAPTNVPTLGAPGPVDPPAVLIPVTGGDNTPLTPVEAAQKVAFNLGLGLVGLGLVLQGIRRRF